METVTQETHMQSSPTATLLAKSWCSSRTRMPMLGLQGVKTLS